MKKISTPIDTATSPTDTVIEMWGTKSPWLPGPIETSTSVAYTNVATNVPRVNCVPRSRMKLRSIRGTNSVEASVSVTIMIEKTTPTTVITAAARAVRIWRAASEVPWITHAGTCRSPAYTARSRACVRAYSAIAAATSSTGSSQRFVLKASRRHSETKGRRSISQWSRSMNTEIAQVVAAPTSLPGSPAPDRSAGLGDCLRAGMHQPGTSADRVSIVTREERCAYHRLGQVPVLAGRRRSVQRISGRGGRLCLAARLRQRRLLEATSVPRLRRRRRCRDQSSARRPLPGPRPLQLRAQLRATPAASSGRRLAGNREPCPPTALRAAGRRRDVPADRRLLGQRGSDRKRFQPERVRDARRARGRPVRDPLL